MEFVLQDILTALLKSIEVPAKTKQKCQFVRKSRRSHDILLPVYMLRRHDGCLLRSFRVYMGVQNSPALHRMGCL